MEDKIRDAMIEELQRQATEDPELSVEVSGRHLLVNGRIDVEALAFVLTGAVAGGP